MGLSIKERREVILILMKELPEIFSNKIYSSMVQDFDISLLELFYDEKLQTCSLRDVFNQFQRAKLDAALINANSIEIINWFEQKMEIMIKFKAEIETIHEQILEGTKIQEKIEEFYTKNQKNIDDWYIMNYSEFNDETNIKKLFLERFESYCLLDAPMRIINVIYSNEDIVQVLQSYHKDKIDVFYS